MILVHSVKVKLSKVLADPKNLVIFLENLLLLDILINGEVIVPVKD